MNQIYVHGLGQNPSSWDKMIEKMGMDKIAICPNLPDLIQQNDMSYHNLYQSFSNFCNGFEKPFHLCGLSLGGVLALNYAIDYPENINSLVLIAAQYKMPKMLLKIQNLIFSIMPKSMFSQTGFCKSDFIQLCSTMMNLDFSQSLHKINCPTLILCGKNDFTNKKASIELSKNLPNSTFVLLDRAGHEINEQSPETLAEILKKFYFNQI